MLEIKDSNWMWQDRETEPDVPNMVLFRKSVILDSAPICTDFRISADSRYKLYINSKFVEVGPAKGDDKVWFYDTLDLLPYLRKGKNVFAIEVLRYPLIHERGNHGIFRTNTPGLYVQGCITTESNNNYSVDADKTWKCISQNGFSIHGEDPFFAPLQIYEDTCLPENLYGWKEDTYDDSHWDTPKIYDELSVCRASSPGNLMQRTIPFMYRLPKRFMEVVRVVRSDSDGPKWLELLQKDEPVKIPGNSHEIVEISAGEEMTGYIKLAVFKGKGAKVNLLQSEGYVLQDTETVPIKGNRTDFEKGHLAGFTDVYHVSGKGEEEHPECYEPFWFRTFRFIRLEIQTGDEPLFVKALTYEETGYPLEVKTEFCTSDPSLGDIWEISERTLRRCMHETYEDCPFYEQLQYAMDSRSQILYTYAISADDRLARKCMDDFRRSQRYDGLLNASYPCFSPNVIPGFSIYYILMVYDHMMYFGDPCLIRDHLPAIDNVLNYFHKHLTDEQLVGKTGGLNLQDRYWSFIDWTKEWDPTTGVPGATLYGPITMESLLYIMGLQHAALLHEYVGHRDMAEEYRREAETVQQAVRKYCMDAEGVLLDGPGIFEYSQHTQVFAVLTDTIDAEQGRKNLLLSLNKKEDFAQCSVAMAFYLFRALEKTDLYEHVNDLLDLWRDMLKKNLTTCVECCSAN